MPNQRFPAREIAQESTSARRMPSRVLVAAACLLLGGCGTGYRKVDGKYAWVTWDEGNGRQCFTIEADEATFQVLKCEEYAKDKNTVFYKNRKIIDADPASFRVLPHTEFSRDDLHVFLFGCTIVGADPNSFVVLPSLFGKDKNHAFAGTVSIKSADPNTFQVEEGAFNSYTSYTFSEFTDRDYFLSRFGMEYADIEVSLERPAIVATGNARDADNHFLKDSARIDQ